MKRLLILSAACMVFAATSAIADTANDPAPAPPLVGAAAEAAQVVDAFKAAVSSGDADAAAAFLADDVLVFEAGYVERSKAEYAGEHLKADAEYSKVVKGAVTRRTGHATGDLAWIASEGATSGRYKDKAVDRVTTETMVLRREPSGWRIVHIHWSSRANNP